MPRSRPSGDRGPARQTSRRGGPPGCGAPRDLYSCSSGASLRGCGVAGGHVSRSTVTRCPEGVSSNFQAHVAGGASRASGSWRSTPGPGRARWPRGNAPVSERRTRAAPPPRRATVLFPAPAGPSIATIGWPRSCVARRMSCAIFARVESAMHALIRDDSGDQLGRVTSKAGLYTRCRPARSGCRSRSDFQRVALLYWDGLPGVQREVEGGGRARRRRGLWRRASTATP